MVCLIVLTGCSTSQPPRDAKSAAAEPSNPNSKSGQSRGGRAEFEKELQREMNAGRLKFKSMTIDYGDGNKANLRDIMPPFSVQLTGRNEVRIRNPNEFEVRAGIRLNQKGKNCAVPAHGVNSVFIPDGTYDIYFIYLNKPDALFRGDSFTLKGNGVEIQIVQVVNGNYGIKQVK